jgi:hypothetical protein
VTARTTDIPAYFVGHWVEISRGTQKWTYRIKGIEAVAGETPAVKRVAVLDVPEGESFSVARDDAWQGVYRFDGVVNILGGATLTSLDPVRNSTAEALVSNAFQKATANVEDGQRFYQVHNLDAPSIDAGKVTIAVGVDGSSWLIRIEASAITDRDGISTVSLTDGASTIDATRDASGAYVAAWPGRDGDVLSIRVFDNHRWFRRGTELRLSVLSTDGEARGRFEIPKTPEVRDLASSSDLVAVATDKLHIFDSETRSVRTVDWASATSAHDIAVVGSSILAADSESIAAIDVEGGNWVVAPSFEGAIEALESDGSNAAMIWSDEKGEQRLSSVHVTGGVPALDLIATLPDGARVIGMSVSGEAVHVLLDTAEGRFVASYDVSGAGQFTKVRVDATNVRAAGDDLIVWGGNMLSRFSRVGSNWSPIAELPQGRAVLDALVRDGHVAILTDGEIAVYRISAAPHETVRLRGVAGRNLSFANRTIVWSRGFKAAPTIVDFDNAASSGFTITMNATGEPATR